MTTNSFTAIVKNKIGSILESDNSWFYEVVIREGEKNDKTR